MKKDTEKNGISLFGQSEFLLESDPIEEIFALNLGDFISEHLISKDLAQKISEKSTNKVQGLKNQLKELISLYSSNKTLCVLNFDTTQEYEIYTAIANTIKLMVEADVCRIYTHKNNQMLIVGTTDDNFGHEICIDFNGEDFINDGNSFYFAMRSGTEILGVIMFESNKSIQSEYVDLVISISKLFATSIKLQSEIDDTNKIIENPESNLEDMQQYRAELTALIGDLCDYQQDFVIELAKAVDKKGQYKVSHSKNTAELAKLICKELELNEKTTDLIYYAGLLQNIGKITLPESIFATNGKLSDDELKKIQNHIKNGVNLLMNINFLSEVVPYITYQNERYDGSGKPEGLKGQSIPLGSRIIAVADVYNALTSERPYRHALNSSEAFELIQKDSKWDPDVVNALKNVI